jgi:hypothetical protein
VTVVNVARQIQKYRGVRPRYSLNDHHRGPRKSLIGDVSFRLEQRRKRASAYREGLLWLDVGGWTFRKEERAHQSMRWSPETKSKCRSRLTSGREY